MEFDKNESKCYLWSYEAIKQKKNNCEKMTLMKKKSHPMLGACHMIKKKFAFLALQEGSRPH